MLPIQDTFIFQGDISPIQNIGIPNQNQSQLYSFSTNSINSLSIKQPRRKRSKNLNHSSPVMINPQIRTTMGVVINELSNPLTLPQKSMPLPLLNASLHNQTRVSNVNLTQDSLDATNKCDLSEKSAISMVLNSLSPMNIQYNSSEFNEPTSMMKINLLQHSTRTAKTTELISNSISNNKSNTTMNRISSNDSESTKSSFIDVEQIYSIDQSNSLSSPSSSKSISINPLRKSKRKYSKRQEKVVPIESLNASQNTFTLTSFHDGLPSYIPASISAPPAKTEKCSGSLDTPATSTNTYTTNCLSNLQKDSQNLPYGLQSINDISINNFIQDIHLFVPNPHHIVCFTPTNTIGKDILPIQDSSILCDKLKSSTLFSLPVMIEERQGRQEKSTQISGENEISIATNEQILEKSKSVNFKAKNKFSIRNDDRIKKKLKRVFRRQQLAILKYMMRKKKLEKKERLLMRKDQSNMTIEQPINELPSQQIKMVEETQSKLPDIVASNLKILFDRDRKVESISLNYYRRRNNKINNDISTTLPVNSDNKLDLLLEAVEFIETFRDKPTINFPLSK